MALHCLSCTHEQRELIDRALVDGSSVRDVGGRVGISKSAIDRHKAHVSEKLVRARESREDARADSLWAQVEDLVSTASRLLTKAEKAGNDRVAVSALRETRETLRFLASLTRPGEASDELIAIMRVFASELRSRPGVAQAVASRLRALDGNQEAQACADAIDGWEFAS